MAKDEKEKYADPRITDPLSNIVKILVTEKVKRSDLPTTIHYAQTVEGKSVRISFSIEDNRTSI